MILIAVNLAFLLLAYLGIEVVQNLRLTVFQPFRMATLARGLCLILLAGHCQRLWSRRNTLDPLRVLWIVTGLLNDWSLVIVTLSEAGFVIADRCERATLARWTRNLTLLAFAGGLVFLGKHDTESGHLPLIAVSLGGLLFTRLRSIRPIVITPGRRLRWLAACWLIPVAALAANLTDATVPAARSSKVTQWLIKRCRFAAVPIDDMEHLAAWCRENTPRGAKFIGPPGPKSFRVWSNRSLAFNRASSPYHAKGLDDWSRRFMEHVGFNGTRSQFVDAYLRNRRELENGYDAMSPEALSRLAEHNEADFIVAASPRSDGLASRVAGPLELIHAEGRYAVYRPISSGVRNREIAAEPSERRSRSRR